MINTILRFLGFFDMNGLKHSISHLDKMQRKIGFLPIGQQAMYADKTCIQNAQNEIFILLQFADFDENDTSVFGDINATAIGNIAYISLYGCDLDLRKRGKKFLENYRKYLGSFV